MLSVCGATKFMPYLCSQKAHVQQFLATEDALNKAAEARDLCQKLKKRLHGGNDISSSSIGIGSTSQNIGGLRQFEVFFKKINYSKLLLLSFKLCILQSTNIPFAYETFSFANFHLINN